MKPTALIYSSHSRCEYIHNDWIVQRALAHPSNKTILYLPMSYERYDMQIQEWEKFKWFFDCFADDGLVANPFFWTDDLRREDVDIFFTMVHNSTVVILGGGLSPVGFRRYNSLGEMLHGDAERFHNMLHQRQMDGKLTVGYSAGAIQLSDASIYENEYRCYSLIHNVTAVLHYEWGREGELYFASQRFPYCLAFGLPNDSGLASNLGYLPSGNKWQVLQFIIDYSWDAPQDGYHIKSRQGMRIEHTYQDGRKWTFDNGDVMVRVFSPDYSYQGTWIIQNENPTVFDYWTQQPSEYQNIEHILNSH